MTPLERAEKIYNEYGRKGSWNLFDKRMINAIAAEIEQAVEEAKREAQAEMYWQPKETVRSQALEEAAKVVETLATFSDIYKARVDFAKAVRALKESN